MSVPFSVAAGLFAYRLAGAIASPLLRRHLRARAAKGKEDPARLGERLGYPAWPRPDGPLIWIHAASVGESVAVLPLMARIRSDWPSVYVLLTTGTVTSAALMAERLPPGILHQYVPVDLTRAVRRFLNHWRPDLAIWTESEFWPNTLAELARRQIPRVLVNGRLSSDSHQKWSRVRPVIVHLLSGFSLCIAQTPDDGWRLEDLGASNVTCLGNLKFAAPALPADATVLARLESEFGARPRWLAASTHPGEEEQIAAVHGTLARSVPDLLTVLVPRHPERGPEIAAELAARGHGIARRGAGEIVSPATEIYLADTLGELGLWYRLCGIAFVGGSLVAHGGQNLLEPARLDCALIVGPHTENFADIVAGLTEAGGASTVPGPDALAREVLRLLEDEAARESVAAAARAFATTEDDVLDRVLEVLRPHFDAALAGAAN